MNSTNIPALLAWVDTASDDLCLGEVLRRVENFRFWYEIGGKNEKYSAADRRKCRETAEAAQMFLDALSSMTDAEHILLKMADYKLSAFDMDFWKAIALRAGWTEKQVSRF